MREENNRKKEFEDIAMEHIDSLYSMAIRLVFNKDEAEDLVQETYLKAYRFFNTFQKGTNIKAWLFKILRNTFINKYRKTVNLPSEIFTKMSNRLIQIYLINRKLLLENQLIL